MARPAMFRASAWLLILVFPAASILADVGPAVLMPAGNVRVNGRETARAMAVFSGDRIQTGESSAAITLKGTTILLPSHTAVVLGPESVQLSEGRALLATSGGTVLTVGGIKVAPALKERARFEVTHARGEVRITSLEGRITVSDGKQEMLLEAGKMLTVASAGYPPVPGSANSLAGAVIAVIAIAVGSIVTAAVVTSVVEPDEQSVSTP